MTFEMKYVTSELKTSKLTLNNRLVLPPMDCGTADADGYVTEKMLNHYQKMTQGGYLSLIIVEHSFIAKEGKATKRQLSVADDQAIEGLRKLTDLIHNNGCKAVLQISHAGSEATTANTGTQVLDPSVVEIPGRKAADKAMSKEDIQKVIKQFADAAKRTVEAGFDAIEIHSGHGYLLNQFYSPLTNLRTDEYGGCLNNRLRIHLEVIEAVKEVVGEDYPLLLRLGACDYMEGGNTPKDGADAAVILEKAGIDILDVAGGMNGIEIKGREKEQGYFYESSEAIKKTVNIPVILTGGIREVQAAEQLIESGKADMIGVGRAMLRDSEWAKKALSC